MLVFLILDLEGLGHQVKLSIFNKGQEMGHKLAHMLSRLQMVTLAGWVGWRVVHCLLLIRHRQGHLLRLNLGLFEILISKGIFLNKWFVIYGHPGLPHIIESKE